MPIKVQGELPAKEILENENIFVMDEKRALSQEIRPLQICILNLMPIKQDTELRVIAFVIKHSITGGYYVYEDEQPYFVKYFGYPY